MILERPIFTSRADYGPRFTDPVFWRPYVAAICARHALGPCAELRAGLPGTNPVFVVDDPPVIPTGDPEPVGATGTAERASSPPEPINERLPPIPAPFPRPDGARIVLDLTIDAEGRVQTINVRRSDDHSVNATVASAARQWRYRPARRNGVAVPSVRTVDIPLSVK